MSREVPEGPHERTVGRDVPTHYPLSIDGLMAAVADVKRLRAVVEALALLLGECADELETELHCAGRASKRSLDTPHRAKAKLRELGLLTPNASSTPD
jgi:hypothetical protein